MTTPPALERMGTAGSPEAAQPKPRQARNTIVAAGLSDQNLARLKASGFEVTAHTHGTIAPRIVRLRLPRGMSASQARRSVRSVNRTAAADFDSFYYTDEGIPGCTGLGCEAATLVGWTPPDAAQCGPEPLIGLIDTGIELDHEALKGQSVESLPNFTSHASPSSRDHGTAIAALLVGRRDSKTPGLIPGAKLLAVDAFYRENDAVDRTDVMSLVAAIETLAARNVRIINLSLSGPPNEVLRKAIQAAHAKGIVLVAAVGNNGAGAEPSYPAAYPGVVAVTAVDRKLNVYGRATRGKYVDLAAPGVEVWTASASGSASPKTGTSYAVPFVSAAAALLRAFDPAMDVEALQARLEKSTRDLGAPGRDPTYGSGLIQMMNLCPPSPSPETQEESVAKSSLQ